jgi:hypothetical protein
MQCVAGPGADGVLEAEVTQVPRGVHGAQVRAAASGRALPEERRPTRT